MDKEEAIKILEFYIDHQIYYDLKDDSKIDTVSEHSKRLINAWEYVKENLK